MSIDLSGFVPKKTKLTIGTTKFIFTELSIADYAELKAHLVEEREKVCEKRRARLIEDAAQIGNIDALELLKLTDSSISDAELEAHAYTVEGIGFLAYLSLRYSHEGISREQVMKIVTLEAIEKIANAMFPMKQVEDIKKKLVVPSKKKVKKRKKPSRK